MEYELWVLRVQQLLVHDYHLPIDSFLLEPHDGSPALKSWREMYDLGTSPEKMAYWTYHVFD